MKLNFIITSVPNFIKTDKGLIFDVADLDTEEFLQYCNEWKNTLADNREKRRKSKEGRRD